MPGAAVRGRDRAGGVQAEQAHDWFVLESKDGEPGDPIVTVADRVEPHGDAPHSPAPVMVEGESWFVIGDSPACRAEHLASCGDRTTGRHWFQLESAGSGYRPYLLNPGDLCNVEHIPWIMRAHGWHEGAKLMDRWFMNDPSTDKSAVPPDTTTITMDFVLRYADASAAYEELKDPADWTAEIVDIPGGVTPLERLCSHLRADNKLTDTPQEFDYVTGSVPDLKKYWVDHAIIEHTELDGLLASLGQFEMFLVLAGTVEPVAGGHKVTVTKSAVFVEDDYDFETFQPLGFWDIRDHRATDDIVEGLFYPCWVFNWDFQNWRTLAKKGGDYMVYSDLKLHEYHPPPVFFC